MMMLEGSLYRWLLTVAAGGADENIRCCSSLFLAYTVEIFFDVVVAVAVAVVAEAKLDGAVDEEVDADATMNNRDVTPRLARKQRMKQKGDEEGGDGKGMKSRK